MIMTKLKTWKNPQKRPVKQLSTLRGGVNFDNLKGFSPPEILGPVKLNESGVH